MYKQLSVLLSFGVVSMLASAQSLYMNDMRLKLDLDWLNTQGITQISTSTWPLTANEIERALQSANASTPAQQQVLQSVRTLLNESTKVGLNTSVGLYAQTDRQQLPQTFDDNQMAGQQATVQLGFTEK